MAYTSRFFRHFQPRRASMMVAALPSHTAAAESAASVMGACAGPLSLGICVRENSSSAISRARSVMPGYRSSSADRTAPRAASSVVGGGIGWCSAIQHMSGRSTEWRLNEQALRYVNPDPAHYANAPAQAGQAA